MTRVIGEFAILGAGYCDVLQLREWTNYFVDIVHGPVDLLNFRTASAVRQYEILLRGGGAKMPEQFCPNAPFLTRN